MYGLAITYLVTSLLLLGRFAYVTLKKVENNSTMDSENDKNN